MKNVLVTLRIYLKENFNYSLSHQDLITFFYTPGFKTSWVIELPNIVMIFEPSCTSDDLGVLHKNADAQRIPSNMQDVFI